MNNIPVLGSGLANTPVTSSPSFVSLPIYDKSTVTINPTGTTPVTIVGACRSLSTPSIGGAMWTSLS
jgi:hypothetical protein